LLFLALFSRFLSTKSQNLRKIRLILIIFDPN
jgi:hypothetical protein